MITRETQSKGGRAVASRKPPETCPKCGRTMAGRSWHSYLGHLGLHGLARNYFADDITAAQEHLRNNGLATQDPAPWNRAWPTYRHLPEKGTE